MSKPWRILYRQNSEALSSAHISLSVAPAYVTPQLLDFQLYDVDRVPTEDFSEVYRGQTVRCFLRVADPDNLITSALITWNGETVGVGKEYWEVHQAGYLLDISSYLSCRTGSDTPTCALRYESGEEEGGGPPS